MWFMGFQLFFCKIMIILNGEIIFEALVTPTLVYWNYTSYVGEI